MNVNERLRMENVFLKKLNALVQEKETLKRKTRCLDRPDKYAEMKSMISTIYHDHKGRYGYRRITLELRNQGFLINHKTVQRLMKELGLKTHQTFLNATSLRQNQMKSR